MVRLLLTRAAATALLAAGCTCEHAAPLEPAEPIEPAPAPVATALSVTWPDAVIALATRPPATRVVVRPDGLEVDNGALVRTWPHAAIERARADPDPSHPEWPRVRARLEPGDASGLVAALAATRHAERAASGAGTGANVCDLRVAAEVSFEAFEAVLVSSGRAGYGSPRVLFGEDDALVAFEWPRAPPASAPSEADVRAALEAMRRGEPPGLADPAASEVRVRITDAGARVLVRGDPRCGEVAPATLTACLRELPSDHVTIEVSPNLDFGDVAPWVQHASTTGRAVSVRSAL
ncbi:MAG: hypothetical protein KF729_24785 [Sandaracinaceae bacterium]|nr:hypothetical protein [Sandaracinaceae bacterium]